MEYVLNLFGTDLKIGTVKSILNITIKSGYKKEAD